MFGRAGEGLEKEIGAGGISGQKRLQVFEVECSGCGENWRVGLGGLRRWCSGECLGGVWAGLGLRGVGYFRGSDDGLLW